MKRELSTGGWGLFWLGHSAWKSENFVDIPRVKFNDCLERRTSRPNGARDTAMISLSDCCKNKKASARPKDLAGLAHDLPDPDKIP